MSDTWTVESLIEGTSWSSSCTLLTNRGYHAIVDTGLSIQEDALIEALERRGLAPTDINLVINTHLHLDHCGNNLLFTRAAICFSEAEWRWAEAFYDALFKSRAPEVAAIEFYPELPLHNLKTRTIRNVARMVRLFWNHARLGSESQYRWLETAPLPPGLEVVPTPGHTPHHISVRVTAGTPTLIAGDAILAEDVHAKVRTMIPFSRVQFAATREALIRQGGTIIPGHGAPFTIPIAATPR